MIAKNQKLRKQSKLTNEDTPFFFTKQLLSSRESTEKLTSKNNDILTPKNITAFTTNFSFCKLFLFYLFSL